MFKTKSIKGKLYFAFAILIIISGFVAGFAYYSIHTIINNTSNINHADSIRIIIKDLRFYEKEFLLHESIDSNFYKTRKSKNLVKAEEHYLRVQRLYKELYKSTYLQKKAIKDLIQKLEKDSDNFMQHYRNLVSQQAKRGFKDWGLIGNLRDKIHAVEDAKLDYDLSYMLMLRRHEKDFFLRKDDKYVDQKFIPAVKKLISHLNSRKTPDNEQVVQDLIAKVMDYQEGLLKVRVIDKLLGYNQFEGVKGKLLLVADVIEDDVTQLHAAIQQKGKAFSKNAEISFIVAFILQLILVLFLGTRFLNRLTSRLKFMKKYILQLAQGKLIQAHQCNTGDELSETFIALNLLNKRIEEATSFTRKIVDNNNNEDISYDAAFKKGVLEEALIHMKDALIEASREKHKTNWVDKSLAKFIEIFNQNTDIQALSQQTISTLSKHLKAQQGAIYMLNDKSVQSELELKGAYGCSIAKIKQSKVLPGEGLVGQAFKQGKTIYLEKLPEQYSLVKTGLVEMAPQVLLIIPVKLNQQVIGVIELLTFESFEKHHLDFLDKLTEYMATFILSRKLINPEIYHIQQNAA